MGSRERHEAGASESGAGAPAREVSLDDVRELGALIPEFIHALKCIGPPDIAIAAMREGTRLGPRHLTALHNILLAGPQSVSELATRMRVALPTASLLVGDLGRAGLVERAEDPADRRRTIVRVPAEHAAAADEFLERRIAPVRRTLACLGAEDRGAFLRGLRRLVDELAAVAEMAPDHVGRDTPIPPSVRLA